MSDALLEHATVVHASIERQLDLADAYSELGYHLGTDAIRELIEAGVPPMAGAAQGLNPAVFMNNVPAPGTYAIDQQRFDLLTERNDVPQSTDTWPGFQSRIDRRVANVGVLANIRIRLNLSVVVSGTGAVTTTYKFPWNLVRRATLNANGGSAIISCEGLDLRARRNRLFRNPQEGGVSSSPNTDARMNPAPATLANGTYSVVLILDLPIVHDPASLTGALFAQSDQNYLNWVIETAQQSDCFTIANGGAVAITGNVDSTLTFYSIPSMDAQNGRVVVLPQAVRWLHEYISQDNVFTNTGLVPTPFIRNNGQLVAAMTYIDNGGTQIAPSALNRILWRYAGNQTPREMIPYALLEENARDYNGLLQPGYFCLDFEKENPARDIVYPRGLSELAVVIDVPSTVTVQPNAHTHTVLETLTTG